MENTRARYRSLALLVVTACVLDASEVGAVSMGIIGNSGKQGSNCADCHSDGTAPLVRLDGPHLVYTGALATFRFVVQSQASRQEIAGFNVAASSGLLETISGQGARVEVDELTHGFPKSGAETSWLFTWRAPQAATNATLFGAGLSANGNGTRSGDGMALLTLPITVSDGPRPGDANCDDALSAADLTEMARLSDMGVVATCEQADADCDGDVDAVDIDVLVASLFDSPVATQCPER